MARVVRKQQLGQIDVQPFKIHVVIFSKPIHVHQVEAQVIGHGLEEPILHFDIG